MITEWLFGYLFVKAEKYEIHVNSVAFLGYMGYCHGHSPASRYLFTYYIYIFYNCSCSSATNSLLNSIILFGVFIMVVESAVQTGQKHISPNSSIGVQRGWDLATVKAIAFSHSLNRFSDLVSCERRHCHPGRANSHQDRHVWHVLNFSIF